MRPVAKSKCISVFISSALFCGVRHDRPFGKTFWFTGCRDVTCNVSAGTTWEDMKFCSKKATPFVGFRSLLARRVCVSATRDRTPQVMSGVLRRS